MFRGPEANRFSRHAEHNTTRFVLSNGNSTQFRHYFEFFGAVPAHTAQEHAHRLAFKGLSH